MICIRPGHGAALANMPNRAVYVAKTVKGWISFIVIIVYKLSAYKRYTRTKDIFGQSIHQYCLVNVPSRTHSAILSLAHDGFCKRQSAVRCIVTDRGHITEVAKG